MDLFTIVVIWAGVVGLGVLFTYLTYDMKYEIKARHWRVRTRRIYARLAVFTVPVIAFLSLLFYAYRGEMNDFWGAVGLSVVEVLTVGLQIFAIAMTSDSAEGYVRTEVVLMNQELEENRRERAKLFEYIDFLQGNDDSDQN